MPDLDELNAADYDATHAHQDATRDLPMATVHLVPPLAAYDIEAKLTAAIISAKADHQEAVRHRVEGVDYEAGYLDGLRRAVCIVFNLDGEDAP